MADKLDVKTFGHSGVIIDQNSLEPTLPDDALKSAQNATHDPTMGYGGALRKRAGLKRFNSAYAGGVILGGIPMAVVGTGGAAATGGGGETGSGAGGGNGSGSPGGTTDGGDPTYAPPGGGSFGGGTLFGGARLIGIAFANNQLANYYGHGWWLTSKKFADVATLITAPGPPATSGAADLTKWLPYPSVVRSDDGFLYYVDAHDESTDTPSPLRRTNGGTDVGGVSIPINRYYPGSGTWQQSVTGMIAASNGMIYMTVLDKHNAGNVGRIMKLDPSTGALTELNLGTPATTPAQYADWPSCLAFFENKVFWGTYFNTSDTSASINVVSSDEAYASVDYQPAADQRFANITCMLSASGVLYAGTGAKTAGVAGAAQILIRQPGAGIAAVGNWLTLDAVTGFGDTLANQNFISSMVEFNGVIYVAWYDPGQKSRILACTPNPNVGGFQSLSPVSSVWSSTGATGRVPYTLFVDDGVLYAVGTTGLAGANRFLWTTDGTTWTDATANFSQVHQEYPNMVLFGVDQ